MNKKLLLEKLFKQLEINVSQEGATVNYGQAIQEVRKIYKKTQADLAKDLNISQATLSDLEPGSSGFVIISMAVPKLFKTLNTTVNEPRATL